MLSVIIPASNEAAWIGPCLDAVLASAPLAIPAEVVVVANGCHDDTAAVARARAGAAAAAGWHLQVIDRPEPGKTGALNAGEAAARGDIRAYLDADVVVDPALLGQVATALATASGAAYATGTAILPRARSAVSRAYGRFWQQLPWPRTTAPGHGFFAMNAAGRARWDEWPALIADDMFARLHFTPAERIQLPAGYSWPLVEGFARLVRVRRRQDAGMRELAHLWPRLLANDDTPRLGVRGLLRLALADPAGFAVYAAVTAAVRLRRGHGGWARGR